MSNTNYVEISLASKIPATIKTGIPLTLNLVGILNTLQDFKDVEILLRGQEIFLDAVAQTNPKMQAMIDRGVVMGGIEKGWKKEMTIPNLGSGIYLLHFNNKFGYLKWTRALTVN